ncbi:MAG: NUDIX domain-containing protein [Chloroflexi bacterium]|nr:NUDIX domain-containing protein [Chloroflexota bacterium]MCH8352029.1 NUDIX domain-containing protein [Chloroflexota bacterium]MCI0782197.1 NUDIX domain-containing protein [Chloroflexota bacterium]MCI0867391.1 NUDIX domain-containing protein [Chloroflexota bacterium]MCI0880258.1 NUDIX domain-containing protein [Chloroflexota bacterium]
MKYCPRCGAELGWKFDGGRERPACQAEGCRFIHFGDFSIGCGGVVIRDNKALLIQRGINPNRGAWQIPGGYVEADEEILTAVEREVLEEAGVVARVLDVVGVRHAIAEPVANIYVVFRLEPVSGEPRYDGEETIGAGYFSLEEMGRMEGVQGFSTWAIHRALATPRGAGFTLEDTELTRQRPGWTLFGAIT